MRGHRHDVLGDAAVEDREVLLGRRPVEVPGRVCRAGREDRRAPELLRLVGVERRPAEPVGRGQDRRDALEQVREPALGAVLRQRDLGVRVGVDEPGLTMRPVASIVAAAVAASSGRAARRPRCGRR